MQFVAIILLCMAAAIAYGIVQDNITARICVEYFSVFHPRIIESSSPAALAFAWGVLATWWVGLGLGVPLALVSRVGRWPKFTARRLIRPIAVLLAVIGVGACGMGWVGWNYGSNDPGLDFRRMENALGPERYRCFWADLAAHQAAYALGAIGGIVLCGWVVYRRWREARRGAAVGA